MAVTLAALITPINDDIEGGISADGADMIRNLQSKVAELEGKLATYEESHPGKFRPEIGLLRITVNFKPGLALPKFHFLSELNDNEIYKEHGCGIQGWLWKRSTDTFASWERRWCWLDRNDPPTFNYYREVESEHELESKGRRGNLQVKTMLASDISEILDKLIWSDGRSHKALNHGDELEACEFQFTRTSRGEATNKGAPAKGTQTPYRFRVLHPGQKNGWLASMKWLARGCHGARPERIAHPKINDRDVARILNDPALCPMPFGRVRHLLVSLFRAQALVNHALTRQSLIFICYNLEMHAMQHEGSDNSADMKAHVGEFLSEIRGVDFAKALRRLSLLYYGKLNSLTYPQQLEEYRHDIHKVALNMISCAVSQWALSKVLPAWHKKNGTTNTHPLSTKWHKRTSAFQIAAVGAASLRLDSLTALFKMIKTQRPPALAQQEKEEAAERIRRNALSAEERTAEDEEIQRIAAEEAANTEFSLFNAGSKLVNSALDGVKYVAEGALDKSAVILGQDHVSDGCRSPRARSPRTPKAIAATPVMNPLLQEELLDESMSAPAEVAIEDSGLDNRDPVALDADAQTPYYLSMVDSDEEAPSDLASSMAADAAVSADTAQNPDRRMNPLLIDDGGDVNATADERQVQLYRSLFAEFDTSCNGYLTVKGTTKLLSRHYEFLLQGKKAHKLLLEHWGEMCDDPEKGLSYEDWRRWDANNGGLRLGKKKGRRITSTCHEQYEASHQGAPAESAAAQKKYFKNAKITMKGIKWDPKQKDPA